MDWPWSRAGLVLLLALFAEGPNLRTDVGADDRQTQSAAVPLEPSKGNIVGDEVVTDQIGTAAMEQADGDRQGPLKVFAPRSG